MMFIWMVVFGGSAGFNKSKEWGYRTLFCYRFGPDVITVVESGK